jgi:hypothetical protein
MQEVVREAKAFEILVYFFIRTLPYFFSLFCHKLNYFKRVEFWCVPHSSTCLLPLNPRVPLSISPPLPVGFGLFSFFLAIQLYPSL